MQPQKFKYGASFSIKYAGKFDLDWQAVMLAALDDLKVRRFRLMSHWDLIEPSPGHFDFKNLDWQFDQVGRRGGEISLAIGWRQPHYPECHQPGWANQLSKTARQEALLAFITEVVLRYRQYQTLKSWQLENEALNRNFGQCHDFDRKRLKRELSLVKQLDHSHPVVMSLSNSWGIPLRPPRPDAYGISIYLRQHRHDGYTDTRLSPLYHRLRLLLIRLIHRRPVFIHELQAEPWGHTSTEKLSSAEQGISMNPNQLTGAISYATKTGLSPTDLWGLEWWYWRKEKFSDPVMWQAAGRVFKG